MLRKISALTIVCSSLFLTTKAQDSTSGTLKITGSVDGYYRYNFNNAKEVPSTNNVTSFTNSHNSFELGMASVKFDYSKGKIGAVADLGFGTRAAEFSYNETGVLAAIKQAYVTYAPSDKVKFTMGKWATHMGYELVDPQLNRNYSMSHLFTFGPFTHTGLKVDFSLGGGFGLMAGISNATDSISAPFGHKNFIAQVSKTSEHVNAYLNYVGGKIGDITVNQIGLTVLGTVSSQFGIGLDGAYKTVDPSVGSNMSWWGAALYLNYDPTDKFGITLRGEHFSDKDNITGYLSGSPVTAGTLSFNIKPVPGIMIIPEFRLDAAKDAIYYKKSDLIAPSQKSTGSFILAAVVSF